LRRDPATVRRQAKRGSSQSDLVEVLEPRTPSHEFTTGSPEAEGTWNYRVIAVDELDESGPESDESGSVKVDRTAPSAPNATTTPPSPYFGPWFKNSVTVGYSGPDVPSVPNDPNLPDGSAGSGVASYTPSHTFSTSGTHNYSGKGDRQRRQRVERDDRPGQGGRDRSDREHQRVPDRGRTAGQQPVAHDIGWRHPLAAEERPERHGRARYEQHRSEAQDRHATDNVDRSASASCTYTVIWDWNGFFRPVDNKDADGDYVLNQAKAGSAIPIKFSLDGPPVPGSNTGQGPSVFAAGYPASNVITCGSSDEVDAIEETATAGSSTLTYDPVADQYVYVWKTLKDWG